MMITVDADSSSPALASRQTWHERFASWIVRRRVRITTVVFVTLVGASFLNGGKPHDLTDFHQTATLAGLALVFAGVALRSWSAGILHKSSQLTTAGPYALVRNPLYVGSLLMMIGFGTLLDQPPIWMALTPLLILFVYTVKGEERQLAARFGKFWDDYAKTTPRFIPRRLSVTTTGGWKLRQWIGNREYQAVSAAAAGLLAVQAWQMA